MQTRSSTNGLQRPQTTTSPTSTTASSSTTASASTETAETSAPASTEAAAATYEKKRAWNPVLTLLNRFGTVKPMSDDERSRDLAYRADRASAMTRAFPDLVKRSEPFDKTLRDAHHILNEGKSFSTIVRLSGLILRNNLENAGQYRTGPNRAASFVAPSAKHVAPLMKAFGAAMDGLIDEAKKSGDDKDARLAAAWGLTVMIRIHPFMDGNGRTARTVMNLALAKSGQQTVDFPSDSEGVYKKSIVWQGLKDHMRGFVGKDGVGWSMTDGIVPPAGYFDKLNRLLSDEIANTSISSLARRKDIVAIADALDHVRANGFQ